MSRRVLVILSHPRLAESIVNRGLIEALRDDRVNLEHAAKADYLEL